MGVRLAYALLMIIFDRINSKENKSRPAPPEETRVQDERMKLTECDHSQINANCEETLKEVFGIGLESKAKRGTAESALDDNGNNKLPLHHSTAIYILNKAQMSIATFQSLVNLGKSGTEMSHRHFPYLNTSITLFYNSEFNADRDIKEHDERLDNILKSWSMYRENIPKDGDCCFRAVARNICRLTQRSGIDSHVTGHLAHLGLLNLNETSLTEKLRALTVSEWSGENRQQYESFLTTDNFEREVELFKHQGYFTGELGNLMVLAMANVLKMPIVIFSSLENFPTIPILPCKQLNGMPPTLFVSFNASGCGHYDYACLGDKESEQLENKKQSGKKVNKEERPHVFCSCGVSRKGQGPSSNICNNVTGSYSSRCKCLKARVRCGGNCTCKGCSNPFGQRNTGNTEMECAPRKRRKFDFQNSTTLKSQEYLDEKGEPLRDGALTKEEFFVVEELIKLIHDTGEELSAESLLGYYAFVQALSCTLEPRPLMLRSKSHDQIKRAIAAHNHDAAVMTALFKKQVELCFSKS